MRDTAGLSDTFDIFVKAFANVDGLGRALERDGRLINTTQLRAFITGFNTRKAYFDFVDVGSGKERADNKLRGKQMTISFHSGPCFRSPILVLTHCYREPWVLFGLFAMQTCHSRMWPRRRLCSSFREPC